MANAFYSAQRQAYSQYLKNISVPSARRASAEIARVGEDMNNLISQMLNHVVNTVPHISKKQAIIIASLMVAAGFGVGIATFAGDGGPSGESGGNAELADSEHSTSGPYRLLNKPIDRTETSGENQEIFLRSGEKILIEKADVGIYRNNVNGFHYADKANESKWDGVDLSAIAQVFQKRPSTEYLWAEANKNITQNGVSEYSDLEKLSLFEGFVEKIDANATAFNGHITNVEELIAGSYCIELRLLPNLGQIVNLFIDGNRLFNINGNPHATADVLVNALLEQKVISVDTYKVKEFSGKMSGEKREMWYVREATPIIK